MLRAAWRQREYAFSSRRPTVRSNSARQPRLAPLRFDAGARTAPPHQDRQRHRPRVVWAAMFPVMWFRTFTRCRPPLRSVHHQPGKLLRLGCVPVRAAANPLRRRARQSLTSRVMCVVQSGTASTQSWGSAAGAPGVCRIIHRKRVAPRRARTPQLPKFTQCDRRRRGTPMLRRFAGQLARTSADQQDESFRQPHGLAARVIGWRVSRRHRFKRDPLFCSGNPRLSGFATPSRARVPLALFRCRPDMVWPHQMRGFNVARLPSIATFHCRVVPYLSRVTVPRGFALAA